MTRSQPDLSELRIRRDDPDPQRSGPHRPWLWVFLAVAAVLLAAWFLLRPRGPEVQIATAAVSGGPSNARGGITANGYVVARTKASVSARIAGRMEYLGVSEGSFVRKGEVIARIESSEYRAALAAARARLLQVEAQLDQARRDLSRSRLLREQAVISDATLEADSTRLAVLDAEQRAALADIELAEVRIENTRVRAPFDGTVLRKDAEVGEMVAPSAAGGGLTRTAIVTMADLATLEVEVDVNEAYIAQIQNGQESRITLDAYPDTSFAGRVRQVVPTADRQKATVQVKVSILDRDPRILPEMGAKVQFVRGEDSGSMIAAPRRVTIPAAAVVRQDGTTQVWVVENGRVEARTVTLGAERGEDIEIQQGLTGGESVVLSPPASLTSGARVRMRSQ